MVGWKTPDWWRTDLGDPRPILMATTSYPSAANPIAGVFVETLSKVLVAEGHRVTVTTPAGGGSAPGEMTTPGGVRLVRSSFVGWRDSPFHRQGLPEALESSTAETLTRSLPAVWSLWRQFGREAALMGRDAMLVGHWLLPGGLLAQATSLATGLPATTVCHSGAVRLLAKFPASLSRPLARQALGGGPYVASCDDVVSVLQDLIGPEVCLRAHVCPMPVPAPIRVAQPPGDGPFRLLTLGRLVPIKGLDLLIEALAPLQDVELNICGAGNARPELETLARRLDVNAIFHGVVTGPRKAELLSGSHGFALTSRRLPGGRTEGSPVALLEALSYGLAVVATDVGGVAQALSDHPEAHLCSPEVNSIRSGLRQMIGQRS